MEQNKAEYLTARNSEVGPIKVPFQHWEDLKDQDIDQLCHRALTKQAAQGVLRVKCFNDEILIDINQRCLKQLVGKQYLELDAPLLELLLLVYLLNAAQIDLSHQLAGISELSCRHFFQGPHEINTSKLISIFGEKQSLFKTAAHRLGGTPISMADAAFRLDPLPRIPLYYLLWVADDEFEASCKILYDRTIEKHFAADAIWGLTNFVSDCLIAAARLKND